MRNEELDSKLIKILEGQAEFKAHIGHIKETLHEIKETDLKQYEQIKIQNGRVGKLEVKVEGLQKGNEKMETNIESNSVRAFWEKNWKAIMFVLMLIMGFKDYLIDFLI